MKLRFNILLLSLFASVNAALADVGMWIPMFIDRNISDMQSKGLHLSAEDIYSVNNASLKDAVVIFGGGCTGEMVSDKGLLFTNYHCGYDAIQKLSSVQHNYLANGFWAMSQEEELPCDGLSVSFLQEIEDVTDKILAGVDTIADMSRRDKVVRERSRDMVVVLSEADSTMQYEVEKFYGGNQYLLYKYKVYTDVRLVGAPPSEIGKFGGDTDNWVWPRHTGDFSIFRVYADKDNNPSDYCSTNVPYKPKKHLQISAEGVKEGDFTMVMGFPGSTNLYASSYEIAMVQNVINPGLVELRTAKLDVMNRFQALDEGIDIQYASKNASTSNAWKKWKGEVKGLKKVGAIERKQKFEADFASRSDEARSILEEYSKIYDEGYAKAMLAHQYNTECIRRGGIELGKLAYSIGQMGMDDDGCVAGDVEKLLIEFYKDYNRELSEKMAIEVMKVYCKNMPRALWPADLMTNKKTVEQYISGIYTSSKLRDKNTAMKMLKGGKLKAKAINGDPAMAMMRELYYDIDKEIDSHFVLKGTPAAVRELDRRYIKAMLETYPDSLLPSDANFTLRVSYGSVAGYEADDAVEYGSFTTLDGIIEKNNTGNADFAIPERLRQLYDAKAFEDYADKSDGKLHVAFVATNHTTGGNSGSPVLNADGQLIGLNFDRAWNGVMSDMIFNPAQCRNITLDIRYLMFIVDKYAGASYLFDEMDIVK
ncbi:MAG: S46 family peptidase [Bacteroidales bacterium]|nr:S46 family peptidase [Bacteroidales bacterium]